MKGSRVQAVVNELHGEKIDIVNWSDNPSEFVSRALAPAKVSSLRFNESEKEVLAIVDEDQLSLAIGKEGQNVRLASKLTGWKIDLMTVKEAETRDKLEQKLQMDISEMYGVTPKIAQKLKGVGILTVQKLHKTPVEELLEIDGIGQKTAEKLKNTARETMAELNKALEELLEKELEAAREKKPLFDDEIFGTGEEKVQAEEVLTEEQLFKDLEEKTEGEEDEEEPLEGAEERETSGKDEMSGEDEISEEEEESSEKDEEEPEREEISSVGASEATPEVRDEEREENRENEDDLNE